MNDLENIEELLFSINVIESRVSFVKSCLEKIKESHESNHIDRLELNVRSYNILHSEGIFTISELIKRSEQDLLKLPGMGKKCISEIKLCLDMFGFKLNG